jgi:hypothetical protein
MRWCKQAFSTRVEDIDIKRIPILVTLTLLGILTPVSLAQTCREIHGRAISYSGDGFLEIWHIGTHHTFFVVDKKSSDLILNYLPYLGNDRQNALFADFTLCPTEKYKKGFSQPTIVKRIRNAHVVVDTLRSDGVR